jgi:hypothetical protein
MWRTAELRWWWPGDAPGALSRWLLRGVAPITDHRTDLYLAHPKATDIGVKQRGHGETEVKVLIGLPEIGLPAKMDGQAELWVKSTGLPLPMNDAKTVAVGKKRERRILAFADGGWADVLSEDETGEGVAVELSAVEANGARWHSVGFEAFGPEDRLTALLQGAVTLFGHWPDTVGPAAVSGGYPLWLAHLAGDAEA